MPNIQMSQALQSYNEVAIPTLIVPNSHFVFSSHIHFLKFFQGKLSILDHTIKHTPTLAGVAQWIEHWPANQSVTGSIPSQGTCLGCRPGPQVRDM